MSEMVNLIQTINIPAIHTQHNMMSKKWKISELAHTQMLDKWVTCIQMMYIMKRVFLCFMKYI